MKTSITRIATIGIAAVMLSARAEWSYNSGTKLATDGNWTISVSSVTGGFKIDKVCAGAGSLNLENFESDTQAGKIVAVGDNAYLGTNLNMTAFIAPDVTVVGEYGVCHTATGFNNTLTTVHISDNFTTLGKYAFAYLNKLSNFSPMDMQGLTSAGASVFDQTALTGDLRLPLLETVNDVFCRIYKGTAGITSVYAPNAKIIGTRAFSGQKLITNVVISAEATQIKDYAFEQCNALVTFSPRQLPLLTSIGVNSFNNCSVMTGAWECVSLTSFGNQAFRSCAKLTGMCASPNSTLIGEFAFDGCAEMTAFPMNLPKLTSLGQYAFNNCTALAGEFTCASLTNMPRFAFYGCKALSGIRAPAVTNIGASAFETCSALTNAVFSENLKAIGGKAFSSDSALASFLPFLPKNIISLGYGAFQSCKKLATPLVWDSPTVTTLPGNLFYQCNLLSNIVFKSDVAEIPGASFGEIALGAEFWFYGEAPTTVTGSFISGSESRYLRYYVKQGAAKTSWLTLVAPYQAIFEACKSNLDYPGNRTFGLLAPDNGSRIWVIDWPKSGLIIQVR